MEPLLCFPAAPPTAVTAVLDRAGYPWRGIDKPEAAESEEPEDGWSGAVISSGDDPIGAFLALPAPAQARGPAGAGDGGRPPRPAR